jgi:hypothetical protein
LLLAHVDTAEGRTVAAEQRYRALAACTDHAGMTTRARLCELHSDWDEAERLYQQPKRRGR